MKKKKSWYARNVTRRLVCTLFWFHSFLSQHDYYHHHVELINNNNNTAHWYWATGIPSVSQLSRLSHSHSLACCFVSPFAALFFFCSHRQILYLYRMQMASVNILLAIYSILFTAHTHTPTPTYAHHTHTRSPAAQTLFTSSKTKKLLRIEVKNISRPYTKTIFFFFFELKFTFRFSHTVFNKNLNFWSHFARRFRLNHQIKYTPPNTSCVCVCLIANWRI